VSAAVTRELIEARLAREREAFSDVLEDLRLRARLDLDLRRRVRERPLAWLAGALALGFFLGTRR
jgi:hypothetical protein